MAMDGKFFLVWNEYFSIRLMWPKKKKPPFGRLTIHCARPFRKTISTRKLNLPATSNQAILKTQESADASFFVFPCFGPRGDASMPAP